LVFIHLKNTQIVKNKTDSVVNSDTKKAASIAINTHKTFSSELSARTKLVSWVSKRLL